MPKSPKPGATRKPPEPTESHAEIDEWMRRVMPDLNPIVNALDRTIRDAIPGLERDFQVISTRMLAGRTVARVHHDVRPGEGFEPAEPTLGDVYFRTLATVAA